MAVRWRALVALGTLWALGCPSPGRGMPPVGHTPVGQTASAGSDRQDAASMARAPETTGAGRPSEETPTDRQPPPEGTVPTPPPFPDTDGDEASGTPDDGATHAVITPPSPPRPLPLVVLYPAEGHFARVGELVRRAVADVQWTGPQAPVRWLPLGLPAETAGLEAWLAGQIPEGALVVRAPMDRALEVVVERAAAARGAPVAHLLPVQRADAAPSPASNTSGSVPLLGAWPLELRALFEAAAARGARKVALLLPESQLPTASLARDEAARFDLEVTEVLGYGPRETAFAEQARRIAAGRPDAVLLVGRAAEVRLAAPALLLAGSRAERERHRRRRAAATTSDEAWTPTWLLPSAAWRPDQLGEHLRPLLGALVAHRLDAEALERLEARHRRHTGQRPRNAYLYQVAAALQCLQQAAATPLLQAASSPLASTVASACAPQPEHYLVLRLCEREGQPALCPLEPPPTVRRD